jgi:hypothetical protein
MFCVFSLFHLDHHSPQTLDSRSRRAAILTIPPSRWCVDPEISAVQGAICIRECITFSRTPVHCTCIVRCNTTFLDMRSQHYLINWYSVFFIMHSRLPDPHRVPLETFLPPSCNSTRSNNPPLFNTYYSFQLLGHISITLYSNDWDVQILRHHPPIATERWGLHPSTTNRLRISAYNNLINSTHTSQ